MGMAQENIQNPYSFPSDDRYFRFHFADMRRMAGLLREFLPKELQDCLDLSRLKRLHEQHLNVTLKEQRDDLNLECPVFLRGRVLVRVLLEHKSYHDAGLWLQLMRSIVTHWEQHEFTAVVSVVVHTGPKPFRLETPRTRLRRMPPALILSQPLLPVYPIDLATCSLERIWNSPHLDAVAQIALSIFKLSQQNKLQIGAVLEVLQRFLPSMSPQRQRRMVQLTVNYLNFKSKLTEHHLTTLRSLMPFVHPVNPQSVVAKYMRKAKAEGIAEGKVEGKAEMRREIAAAMLEKGMDWNLICHITGVSEAQYNNLR
jgi:hypothetical protein